MIGACAGRPWCGPAAAPIRMTGVTRRSSRRRGRRPTAVKRVLLTGMSGTRKSSVIDELAALGYKAVDTDDGWCEPLPDGRQRWREDAIAALLGTEDADVLFLAGCEENRVRFHSRFDLIILLSAPARTMTGRLAARAGNPYGKAPGDMDRILADLAAVKPLLRKAADADPGRARGEHQA